MKIGIDARLVAQTGVGRYITSLVTHLGHLDKKNDYVIFLRREEYETFVSPNARWTKRLADIPWHSFKEQIQLPTILAREHFDLVHIPYFTIPLLYQGKIVVTMHDLTVLHFPTGKASKLAPIVYWSKQLGYRATLAVGLRRASHVIAVSKTTQRELVDHYGLDEARMSVIYEGVDIEKTIPKKLMDEPYILYVGNAYPHKNLETLLFALKAQSPMGPRRPMSLVCVGRIDSFYERLQVLAQEIGLGRQCRFWGWANDQELASLYTHATALVFPSLMEGFGLPALEALSYGTPVVCSDIPVFHEIIGTLGNYFPPRSVASLVKILDRASSGFIPKPTADQRRLIRSRFRWSTMASETLSVYERV